MGSKSWRKVENDAGYPCYIDEATGEQQYDHPEFRKIIESLKEYDGIKYSAYRTAFKIFALQKYFKVPPLRISSGVFSRHQLSLSESSLSLDPAELEAVLADIYFAAKKDGLFTGDVDLTVDLLINLLLNVYDKDRKEPVRVLAAKTLLVILSEESASDKWAALANCCADHNGCVSPRRLAALLGHVAALLSYFGTNCDTIQSDVDACFNKSAGMLGLSARAVAEWGAQGCATLRGVSAAQRAAAARGRVSTPAAASTVCALCTRQLQQVLIFKCSKCSETYFCENCYLYDKDLTKVSGHKKTHLIHEIIDGQTKPSECLGFIKGMKRFFFCTKTKKKKTSKGSKKNTDKDARGTVRRRKDGRPVIFTSTVGKASGNSANNPASMLQDIIMQLETQNKTLKELTSQLQNATEPTEDGLKAKVDAHWSHITTQINRLKILKETLTTNPQELPENGKSDKNDRPQAFDLFSPIPIVDEKQGKATDNLKNQPRVLSLDSGNFSVVSKQMESQNLLTVSGDALKPVVIHATSDSISAVSMNDISNWYNEPGTQASDKTIRQPINHKPKQMECISVEEKFAADILSVETTNDKMKELNADLDTVLDRLQQILTNNFAMDDSCFDNTQLRETANEMEGLLGSLIRGVERRATLDTTKGLV